MAIKHCMTCGKKHAGNFFKCTNCGYVSCQKEGGFVKYPSCKKGGTRKLDK